MFRVDCEVTVIDAYSHGIIGKQIVRGYIPAKTIYSIEKFAERLYFVHTAESGTTNTTHVLFGPDGYPRGIASSKPNDDQILAAILSIVEFVKE